LSAGLKIGQAGVGLDMKLFRLLVLILPLFLTACGLSDQQKADYASVQRSGVSSAIYDKMVHGDALSLYDIESLSRARVSDGAILRYMRDRATIYTLNSADVQELRNAGVSQSIVDYMLETPRMYAPVPVYPYPYGYPYPYPPIAIGIGWGGGGYHHWH
jgi:hypothetical protein